MENKIVHTCSVYSSTLDTSSLHIDVTIMTWKGQTFEAADLVPPFCSHRITSLTANLTTNIPGIIALGLGQVCILVNQNHY